MPIPRYSLGPNFWRYNSVLRLIIYVRTYPRFPSKAALPTFSAMYNMIVCVAIRQKQEEVIRTSQIVSAEGEQL
jgi:hypothetical protein